MLIKDIVNQKNFAFYREAADWKDAVRKCCQPMVVNGVIGEDYAERVIECVKKYGPYIVILPGVAIPHCNESCELAYKTAIGFAKFEKPVIFDKEDKEKNATVFFTLSATDHNKHLENLLKLSSILEDGKILGQLFRARSEADLLKIDQQIKL